MLWSNKLTSSQLWDRSSVQHHATVVTIIDRAPKNLWSELERRNERKYGVVGILDTHPRSHDPDSRPIAAARINQPLDVWQDIDDTHIAGEQDDGTNWSLARRTSVRDLNQTWKVVVRASCEARRRAIGPYWRARVDEVSHVRWATVKDQWPAFTESHVAIPEPWLLGRESGTGALPPDAAATHCKVKGMRLTPSARPGDESPSTP